MTRVLIVAAVVFVFSGIASAQSNEMRVAFVSMTTRVDVSSTTLTAVGGASFDLRAGRTYRLRGHLLLSCDPIGGCALGLASTGRIANRRALFKAHGAMTPSLVDIDSVLAPTHDQALVLEFGLAKGSKGQSSLLPGGALEVLEVRR